MKTWKKTTLAGLAVVAVGAGGWGASTVWAETTSPSPSTTPSATSTSSTATADAALKKNLVRLREEERMARDLYRALAAKHGSQAEAFTRIAEGEQRHYEAIGRLLDRYGISDPAQGRSAGSYADPQVQKLYDSLLTKGQSSLKEAWQVGITVEKTDITDLDKAIKETSQEDARRTMNRLKEGSQHHLEAFTAWAKGETPAGMHARRGEGRGARDGRGAGEDDGRGPREGRGPQGRQGQGPKAPADRPADCPRR